MSEERLLAEIRADLPADAILTTAALRAIRRRYSRHLSSATGDAVLQLARRLLEPPSYLRRVFVCELIHHHPAALAAVGENEVVWLGTGIDSWGAVDVFACYVSGPAWRERQIGDTTIHSWAASADRWWRRAALVSTVPLNTKARGGHGDARRTLAVCRRLVRDRDDMVVKALSWASRALIPRDREAVVTFLAQHDGDLAPRVVREVRHKLETGRKS